MKKQIEYKKFMQPFALFCTEWKFLSRNKEAGH